MGLLREGARVTREHPGLKEVVEEWREGLGEYYSKVLGRGRIGHRIEEGSVAGSFSLGKILNMSSQSAGSVSITTDSSYLFVFMTNFSKGIMLKVGTGHNQTHPGRVYHSHSTEKDSEVVWVYCRGFLYLRKANDEVSINTIFKLP